MPGRGDGLVEGGEHVCLAHAQDVAAGQAPVDVAGQGGHPVDVGYVGLCGGDGAVEVGDGPALGDVEAEQLGQGGGGLGGDGVAPGAEGGQELALGV